MDRKEEIPCLCFDIFKISVQFRPKKKIGNFEENVESVKKTNVSLRHNIKIAWKQQRL